MMKTIKISVTGIMAAIVAGVAVQMWACDSDDPANSQPGASGQGGSRAEAPDDPKGQAGSGGLAENGEGGSGGQAAGGSVNGSPLEQACAAGRAWTDRCNDTDPSDAGSYYPELCVKNLSCGENNIREDVFVGMASCFATHPCNKTDDECGVKPAPAKATPRHLAETNRCMAKNQSCPGVLGTDVCTVVPALKEDSLQAVSLCFDKPCDQLGACFRQATGFPCSE